MALIEQFITPDHCQITGQERQKAMKMPRKSCQAPSAERDRRVCHSGVGEVLFYLVLIISLVFGLQKLQIDAFVSGKLVSSGNE